MDLPDLVQRVIADTSLYTAGFDNITRQLDAFRAATEQVNPTTQKSLSQAMDGFDGATAAVTRLNKEMEKLIALHQQLNKANAQNPSYQPFRPPIPSYMASNNLERTVGRQLAAGVFDPNSETARLFEAQSLASRATAAVREKEELQKRVEQASVKSALSGAGYSSVADLMGVRRGQNIIQGADADEALQKQKQAIRDAHKLQQDLGGLMDEVDVHQRLAQGGFGSASEAFGHAKLNKILDSSAKDDVDEQAKAFKDNLRKQAQAQSGDEFKSLADEMNSQGKSNKELSSVKDRQDWNARINRRLRMDGQKEMVGEADLGFKPTRITDVLKEAPGKMLEGFKAAPGQIATYFAGLPDRIGQYFSQLPGRLNLALGRMYDGVKNWSTGIVGHVWNFSKGVVSGVGSFVSGTFSGVTNFFKGMFNVDSVLGLVTTIAGVRLAFAAVQGVIHGVTSAVTSLVEKGAGLEKLRVEFGVLTGSMANGRALVGQIQQMSIVSPYAVDSLTNTSRLLLGMGVHAQDLTSILSRLGDMAGGDASRLQRLALAVGEVMEEGRLTGQRFRQFANLGIGLQDFADTMGLTAAQVRNLIHSNALDANIVFETINRLTREHGRFADMTKEVLNTTSGQWNRLANVIDVVTSKAGVAFLEQMGASRGLSTLADYVASLESRVIEFAGKVGQALGAAFAEVGHVLDGFKRGGDYLTLMAGRISDVIPGLSLVKGASEGIADVFLNILDLIGSMIAKLTQFLGKILEGVPAAVWKFSHSRIGGWMGVPEMTKEEYSDMGRAINPFSSVMQASPDIWKNFMQEVRIGTNVSRRDAVPAVIAKPKETAPIPLFRGIGSEAQELVAQIQKVVGVVGNTGRVATHGTGVTPADQIQEQFRRFQEARFGSDLDQKALANTARTGLSTAGGLFGGLGQAGASELWRALKPTAAGGAGQALMGMDAFFRNNSGLANMIGGLLASQVPDKLKIPGGLDAKATEYGQYMIFQNLRKEASQLTSHYEPPKAEAFGTREAADTINRAQIDQKNTAEQMADDISTIKEYSKDQVATMKEVAAASTNVKAISDFLQGLQGQGVKP